MTVQPPIFIRVCRSKKVFGVHRSIVYRWAHKGLIKIYKRGNVSVVHREEIERLFAEGEKCARKIPANQPGATGSTRRL